MCPEFDECDPVAKSLGFLHEMRHQQDCRSAVTNMLDEFPGIPAGLRIEPGCHLVEDGDLGRADERQHHGQALLLAAGERAVVGRALIGEPERPDQLTHIGRMTIEGPVHVDDLADFELGREGARLQLHAGDLVDTGFVRLRVDAHQADRPRVLGTGGRWRTRLWWSFLPHSVRGFRRSRPRLQRKRCRRQRPAHRRSCAVARSQRPTLLALPPRSPEASKFPAHSPACRRLALVYPVPEPASSACALLPPSSELIPRDRASIPWRSPVAIWFITSLMYQWSWTLSIHDQAPNRVDDLKPQGR